MWPSVRPWQDVFRVRTYPIYSNVFDTWFSQTNVSLSVTFLSSQFSKLRAPRIIIRYEVICVIGESTSLSWDRLEQTSFKMIRTVRTRLVPNYKLTFDPFRIVTLNSLGQENKVTTKDCCKRQRNCSKTTEIKFYFLGNILYDHESRDKKLKLELKIGAT